MPPTIAASTTRGARICHSTASSILLSGECTWRNGRWDSADSPIPVAPIPTGPPPPPPAPRARRAEERPEEAPPGGHPPRARDASRPYGRLGSADGRHYFFRA